MQTTVLSIHTPTLFSQAVDAAVALLKAGQPVALPTETVYGLAANALNPDAVQRIFDTKGRPPSNPIIVHVASLSMARACTSHWPEIANLLASSFWPGPLTLVLPKANTIPNIVTAHGPTVGIRWPLHPFFLAVIQACDFPLAAPSANLSNQLSPTSADHVLHQLNGKISLIVDGGNCNVGIESTVLDLTTSPPTLLRPGMIDSDLLHACLGSPPQTLHHHPQTTSSPARSPGQLPVHYAPKAPLRISSWSNSEELHQRLFQWTTHLASVFVLAHRVIPRTLGPVHVELIPDDPEAFARALYAALHHCDQAGASLIVVEEPPDLPQWQGIRDRLRRASTP